jgi:hypothetical protein
MGIADMAVYRYYRPSMQSRRELEPVFSAYIAPSPESAPEPPGATYRW